MFLSASTPWQDRIGPWSACFYYYATNFSYQSMTARDEPSLSKYSILLSRILCQVLIGFIRLACQDV